MDPIARFGAYAAAFEKAFAADDWSVVEPFFSEDAVYEVKADTPFGGTHVGRNAILAGFKRSLDQFDRRFDAREPELLEGPSLRDGAVWMRWRVTYRLAGAPDFVLEGEERAWLEGDRIRRLEDRMPGLGQQARDYLAKHAARLRPIPG